MATDKTFKYGELEREFDLLDYVCTERWETALEQLGLANTEAAAQERDSAKVKGLVLAIYAFYDNVLGEGSAKLALGGTTRLEDALDAAAKLVAFVEAQGAALENKYSTYLPKARK